MVLIFGVTFLILWQIDAFMRPMMTEQRQTILIGNEHFPLDNSERERLRMALKKCPNLGKTSQKRRINGKMESCLCIYLSSFPSEVKRNFEEGENQKLRLTTNSMISSKINRLLKSYLKLPSIRV